MCILKRSREGIGKTFLGKSHSARLLYVLEVSLSGKQFFLRKTYPALPRASATG